MAKIPEALHEHINGAFPANVCLLASVLRNGFAQVTPRGSMMVLGDERLAFWERGRGSTTSDLSDGAKLTMFFRKPELRASLLPRGGIARFYGVASIHRAGHLYEEVWRRLIEPEKKGDPDRRGFAVVMDVQRAEDLSGNPLA